MLRFIKKVLKLREKLVLQKTDGQTDERIDERIDDRTDERKYEQTDGRTG